MRKISLLLSVLVASQLLVGFAHGQNAVVNYKATATTPGSIPVTPGTPLPVTGSFSASLGGFVPSLSYGTLTATAASSASTALPTNTGTVAFQNQNAVAVSCTLAAGAATATTNQIIVPAGSTVFVGTTGYDHTACINQTGSASNVIVLAGGSGLGTGFGGGSSSGGGGTALTDNSAFTQGTTNETPIGCLYNTSYAGATSGRSTVARCGQTGDVYTNLDQIVGAAPSATNPLWMAGAQAASTTMQSAAVANGNGSTLTVTGYQTALVNVNCSVACSSGTTINFEGTDSTGTYFSIAGIPVTGASAAVLSTTTSGQFWVPVSGLTTIRARISNYSAGTITVTGTPVFGTNSTVAQVANALASVQANNGTNGAAGTVTTPITEQNGTAYANKSNWTSGTGNGTTTGAITVIAAPAANSLYIKSVQCARDDAGTTAMRVTFSDAQSSVMVLPNNGGGGGNNATFDPPIKVAATTAFTVTPSSAITTIRCNAQGFIAP